MCKNHLQSAWASGPLKSLGDRSVAARVRSRRRDDNWVKLGMKSETENEVMAAEQLVTLGIQMAVTHAIIQLASNW